MKKRPLEIIQSLKKDVVFLEPAKLIPALLEMCNQNFNEQFLQQLAVDKEKRLNIYRKRKGLSDASSLQLKQSELDSVMETDTELSQQTASMYAPRRTMEHRIQSRVFFRPFNPEIEVIKYLKWCIVNQKNMDPVIHNMMVYFRARQPGKEGEQKLIEFLNVESDDNLYSKEFALRVCYEHERYLACIKLYSAMGLHTSAVTFALYVSNTFVNYC